MDRDSVSQFWLPFESQLCIIIVNLSRAPSLIRYILFLAIIYPNLKLYFSSNPWKICPVVPSHTLFLDLVKSSLYSEILSPPPRNPFPEPWKSPGGGLELGPVCKSVESIGEQSLAKLTSTNPPKLGVLPKGNVKAVGGGPISTTKYVWIYPSLFRPLF